MAGIGCSHRRFISLALAAALAIGVTILQPSTAAPLPRNAGQVGELRPLALNAADRSHLDASGPRPWLERNIPRMPGHGAVLPEGRSRHFAALVALVLALWLALEHRRHWTRLGRAPRAPPFLRPE